MRGLPALVMSICETNKSLKAALSRIYIVNTDKGINSSLSTVTHIVMLQIKSTDPSGREDCRSMKTIYEVISMYS
jgi:hypothetical protein